MGQPLLFCRSVRTAHTVKLDYVTSEKTISLWEARGNGHWLLGTRSPLTLADGREEGCVATAMVLFREDLEALRAAIDVMLALTDEPNNGRLT